MDQSETGQRGSEATVHRAQVSSVQLQTYIRDAVFPASKNQLIHTAEDRCAPDSVIELLRNIPEKEYVSPPDVGKAVFPQKGTTTRSLEDRRRGIYR